MNFSDYLNEYNKQASLNEGVSGFCDFANTKECHDLVQNFSKKSLGEYWCQPNIIGDFIDLDSEFRFDDGIAFKIFLKLDNSVSIKKIEYVPISFKKECKTLKDLSSAYNKALAKATKEIETFLNVAKDALTK